MSKHNGENKKDVRPGEAGASRADPGDPKNRETTKLKVPEHRKAEKPPACGGSYQSPDEREAAYSAQVEKGEKAAKAQTRAEAKAAAGL